MMRALLVLEESWPDAVKVVPAASADVMRCALGASEGRE